MRRPAAVRSRCERNEMRSVRLLTSQCSRGGNGTFSLAELRRSLRWKITNSPVDVRFRFA